MPQKIIVIGQSRLEIDFDHNGNPAKAVAGGQLLTAAMALAQKGFPVHLVSEVARDAAGDQIVSALTEATVDMTSVDRYTEGTTAAVLNYADGRQVWYGEYPDAPLSVIWPRIERGDILIFGGSYTLSPRVHAQTMDLLRYAHDLKALVIYAPLFPARLSHLVTHAMPAVLDSFEAASLSIVDNDTLKALYRTDNITEAYNAHLSYYDAPAIHCSGSKLSINMPTIKESADAAAHHSVADLIRATAESAIALGITANEPKEFTRERASALLKNITETLCQQH